MDDRCPFCTLEADEGFDFDDSVLDQFDDADDAPECDRLEPDEVPGYLELVERILTIGENDHAIGSSRGHRLWIRDQVASIEEAMRDVEWLITDIDSGGEASNMWKLDELEWLLTRSQAMLDRLERFLAARTATAA